MLFERPDTGERAVLVHIDFNSDTEREDPQEFRELVRSAGAESVGFITGRRNAPHPRLFVGSGKAEEIRELLQAQEGEVVLFNHSLSPSQERNLESELKCRVLDRTGLILDIFAQRARTHEGKLQVELAQLEHMSTRLIRGWTHLERQKGGIGLRGPGETQLESDRRLLRARIKSIQNRLERVRGQRELQRRSRKRAEVPAVSLVGYTNAGKSTLFNTLTTSGVYAADQLFATLDPTVRRLVMPDIGPVVLADTVGFIRHLPHKLVEAFRATLEEAAKADLLVHVVDAASEERDDHREQVHEVLEEIGAADIPVLEVFNKIDLLNQSPRLEREDPDGPVTRAWLSARRAQGLDLLEQAIASHLVDELVEKTLRIPATEGRLRARLHALQAVSAERADDEGHFILDLRLPRADLERELAAAGWSRQQRRQWLGPARDED